VSNALKAIADSTLALKVERQASSLPLKELEAKIARFESELQGVEKEREMSLFLLDGRLQGVIKTFDGDLESFKRETTERLRREIAAAFQEKSQRSPDLRKDMEDFLFASLRDLFPAGVARRSTSFPTCWRTPTRISPDASMPSWTA
jgi:hypothetical protein